MANKKPEPSPQSVTFLTPDDLAPIMATLEEQAAQIAALEAGVLELEERVTMLEAGEPPDPGVPPDASAADTTVFDARMIEFGIPAGDYLSTNPSVDEKIAWVYYDMCRGMYNMADYTGSPEPWNTYAKQAMRWYRDEYVVPNNGAVTGYSNFTTGLRLDYERTGDEASKAAAISVSQNAMYAADWTDPNYVATHSKSREVAYALIGYINAEALGEAKRDIRARYVDLSYDYCTQWQDRSTWADWQISPFMMALTAQALIADFEETGDARCVPALRQLADWMWPLAWHEPTSALLYQLNPQNVSEGGLSTQGAPDLNMLCSPWLAFLWAQTGDVQYRDKFDALLYGFKDAYLAQGKQWSQNAMWSFEGLAWREGA